MTQTPYAGLLPCRSCGSECRVETFGFGKFVPPTDLWICSGHTMFGGNCKSDLSYFSAEAWNTRPEAAEAISSLLKRVGELEGALRPFADHPDFHASDDWAVTKLDDGSDEVPGVTAGDFRRARAALNSDAPLTIRKG